jgi:NTE family protein
MIDRRRWLAAGAAAAALPDARAAATAPGGGAARMRRLGIALGSGSIHGLAHVGVVRACEALGAKPHAIAGTSAGAVIGAMWAAGLNAIQIEREARAITWGRATDWVLPWQGLMNNAGLQQAVARAVAQRPIESWPTKFAAVATQAADGSPVVITRGPIGPAVGASSAIPVMFEPVAVGGRELVDGSLVSPVPVDAARALGAEVVLAVDVAYRPHEAPARGITGLAFQTLHIMINALAAEQMRRADVTIRLDLHHLMMNSSDPAPLIDAGEAAMRNAWPQLSALLSRPAVR